MEKLKVLGDRTKFKEKMKQLCDNGLISFQRSVICLNDGNKFLSIKHAANFYSLNHGHISAVCKDKRKHTGGYKFKYYEIGDENRIVLEPRIVKKEKIFGPKNPKFRKVLCINNNKAFDSIVEAAKYYLIYKSAISKVARR